MEKRKTRKTLGQILAELMQELPAEQVKNVPTEAGISPRSFRRILTNPDTTPFLCTLGGILRALHASKRDKELALAAAGYPTTKTLGGALAYIILEKEISLKQVVANPEISPRNLTKILKNQTRPFRYTVNVILDAIGASARQRQHVLRVGGYVGVKNHGFGRLHRQYRLERNIPLYKHAETIGITPHNLYRWEKGYAYHPDRQRVENSIAAMKLPKPKARKLRKAANYVT